MLRCMTVRELLHGKPVCRFFGFLIYISVRFVYISVTHLFTLFFRSSLCQNPWHDIFTLPTVPTVASHCFITVFFCHERCQNLPTMPQEP